MKLNLYHLDISQKFSVSLLLILGVSGVTLACSDVIVNLPPTAGMSAGEMMQTAGMLSPMGGVMGGEVSGGGVVLPERCMPGTEITTCAICGINSTPIQPNNDPNCPYIPCEELTRYQTMDLGGGGRQCLQYVSEPPLSNCKAVGECYTDPNEACTLNPEPQVILTSYPGCTQFQGCDGASSPDAVIKSAGEVCHTLGTCLDDGRCSVPASCEGDKPDYVVKHCPDPDIPNDEVEGCDLLVDMVNVPDLNEISCTIACATENGCINGWDVGSDCDRRGPVGCSTSRDRLICRCNGS